MEKFERIKARWRDKVIEGLKLESPYDDIVVIKLDNGYNIGIRKDELFIISKEEIKDTEIKIEENEKLEVKEKEKNEKHIAIIGLGGTIASKVDYKTGAVYPTITASDLKAEFPDLENCDVYQLFNIFSEEMQPYHWEQIAEQTFKLLRNYDGLILLHGTDTMHYTSAALSFAIKTDKPIILVGAQRSSDRPSSDNKVNLLNAYFAAQQDFGEVTVCMHSSLNDYSCYIHRGTKVRKMHSSRRDAFKSININPLAVVNYKAS
jgi:glutamyl-tRNA(Gln) amidotransferase subunit D